MLLSLQDAKLFFKLQLGLLTYVNERRGLVPELGRPGEVPHLPLDAAAKLRDELLKAPELAEAFVAVNPAGLSEEELEIVRSWRHKVAGEFYIYRCLARHTIFLSADEPPAAYGVVALSQPLDEIVGPRLPVLTKTVLLPFKGRIVYDGLLDSYNVSFGLGFRRSLAEEYREAKERLGIVTTLPPPEQHPSGKPRPPKAKSRRQAAAGETAGDAARVIGGLVDQFCRDHLNDEYAEMCRRLTEKLARKRPSPLIRGQASGWASGIVRTIGMVNFLQDPSQQPHIKTADIDKALGVSQATSNNRSMQIRKLLSLTPLDPEWTLPSRLDDNLLVWMLNVNGFPMDIRHAPREAQVAAFEEGLIPYIPADREQTGVRDR